MSLVLQGTVLQGTVMDCIIVATAFDALGPIHVCDLPTVTKITAFAWQLYPIVNSLAT